MMRDQIESASRVVSDEEDGGPRSAEGYSQNARSFGERKQQRKEGAGLHPVGLVEAVLHGGAEEIAATLREGRDEESGGLDVGYGVFAGVGARGEGRGPCSVARLAEGRASSKFQVRFCPQVAVITIFWSRLRRSFRRGSRRLRCRGGLRGGRPLRGSAGGSS